MRLRHSGHVNVKPTFTQRDHSLLGSVCTATTSVKAANFEMSRIVEGEYH